MRRSSAAVEKALHDIPNIPVSQFLRLSEFLNHPYNLYRIPAHLNSYKRNIGIEEYDLVRLVRLTAEDDLRPSIFIENEIPRH